MTGADSPVMADSSTLAMPSIDVAVAGDDLAGLDHHHVALLQPGGGHLFLGPSARCSRAVVSCGLPQAAACALPRPSATASARLANTTVAHSQPRWPGEHVGAGRRGEDGGEDRADPHHEHHRLVHLVAGVEFPERAGQ